MTEAETLKLIQEAIAFAVPELKARPIGMKDTIGELGISSISVLEIVGYVEDKLGVRFPDDELSQLNTIGGLSSLIQAHAASAPQAIG